MCNSNFGSKTIFFSYTFHTIPEQLSSLGISKTKMSKEEIMYMLYHIFLPPKLPQKNDAEPKYDKALLGMVVKCMSSFKDYVAGMHRSIVHSALKAIQSASEVHEECSGALVVSETRLKSAFARLCAEGETSKFATAAGADNAQAARFPFT